MEEQEIYRRRTKKFESVDAELKSILNIAGGVYPEQITPESKVRELLNDSIDQVHALLLIEAFLHTNSKVVIPDEIVERIITYADLLEFVEEAVQIFDRPKIKKE